MKKTFIIYTAILFLISSLSLAQGITATLGGNSSTDYYDIVDNTGTVLFRLNGLGNLGVGKTPLEKLDVEGSVNIASTGAFKQNSFSILNCASGYTLVGVQAGLNNTGASYNTFVGYRAGYNNTESSNTFIGDNAGYSNTTGSNNVFVGKWAGKGVTDAVFNVCIGASAGVSSNANGNVFVGAYAGKSTTGERNIFMGHNAGVANTTGAKNIFIGNASGWDNESAGYQVFIGSETGYSHVSGDHNIFIGYHSGYYNETGTSNVFIGSNSGRNNISGDKNVFIGTSAGYNETGSNKLYIDNSSTASPLIYGDFGLNDLTVNGDLTVTGTITELSDRRYKTEIEPIKNALQKIDAINAVYYKWDKEKYPNLVVSDEREIGVIAQDVEKVFPELVKTDDKGFKSVNYAKLSAVLLEVIKEQQDELEKLKDEVSEIKNVNKKLELTYREQTKAILKLTKAVERITGNNQIRVTTISK